MDKSINQEVVWVPYHLTKSTQSIGIIKLEIGERTEQKNWDAVNPLLNVAVRISEIRTAISRLSR